MSFKVRGEIKIVLYKQKQRTIASKPAPKKIKRKSFRMNENNPGGKDRTTEMNEWHQKKINR